MKNTWPRNAVKFMVLVVLAVTAAAMMCPQRSLRTMGAAQAPAVIKSYDVTADGTKTWVDTNIDLRGGAKLRFTATGQITYPEDSTYKGKGRTVGTFGPDGLARGWAAGFLAGGLIQDSKFEIRNLRFEIRYSRFEIRD